jgi:long-chain acyl-CoA synthetase
VIGVPHEIYGEVPVAYLVTYPDASVTAEDLLALCRANLTKIKIPTAITSCPSCRRTPSARSTSPPCARRANDQPRRP